VQQNDEPPGRPPLSGRCAVCEKKKEDSDHYTDTSAGGMRSFYVSLFTLVACALGHSGSLMGNGPTWENLTHASGTIFVIRHGEKNKAGNHLNETGQMRAAFVKRLWGSHGRFPSPKKIFANLYDEEYNSVELVEPLARSLNLSVNSSFNRENNFRAAGAILTELSMQTSPILIAWEHKHIVRLLVDMGCGRPWLEPWWSTHWPKTDFDEIFILSFVNGTCPNVDITKEHFSSSLKLDIAWPWWSCVPVFMLFLFSVAVITYQKRQQPKLLAEHGSKADSPLLGA